MNIKILLISPSFYPATIYGGPIYSTYELAQALIKTGVDVRVITTNANGNEKLKIKTGTFHKLENDLPVKYYRSLDSRGTSLSMFFNSWKHIKDADIVYLISIFSAPTPITIFLCKLFKKPLIISPRGQLGKWCLEQGNRFKKLWLHTFILSRRNPIHRVKTEQPVSAKPDDSGEDGSANLSAEAQSAKEDHSVYWHLTSTQEEKDVLSVYRAAKTFVIPSGVNSELFSHNDKKKDKSFYNRFTGFACDEKKIIISMGRLQKVKGFDILIEAVSKVQELAPSASGGLFRDLVLLIAGEDFGERKNLEEIIHKFQLNDRVFLIGHIEGAEKIKFLHNADVFALPSHHENFGIVYAEALATGTPVVASTNTPWQDVEKYNCGKWVEKTPELFAKAINEILNSDPVQMGKNGSKYIEDNFSWDIISSEFQEICTTIIK